MSAKRGDTAPTAVGAGAQHAGAAGRQGSPRGGGGVDPQQPAINRDPAVHTEERRSQPQAMKFDQATSRVIARCARQPCRLWCLWSSV
jgi:hypothetical protein